MNDYNVIKDLDGKEYLIFDDTEIYSDKKMGNKIDDFEILIKVGMCPFGKVLKIRSKENKKIYAIEKIDINELKEENEKAYEYVLKRVKFLERLSHPHIIKNYNDFQEGNYLYIIIEYLSNGSLNDFFDAHNKVNKAISEEILWNIFLQCMWALTYIHSKGIIHRNITLTNILMDNNMKIKLAGIEVGCTEKNKKDNEYSENSYLFKVQTDENSNLGIEQYFSKEEKEMNENDQKTDVYYMGKCFYELCYFKSYKDKIKISDDNNINKGVKYSKELANLINSMLEEKEKRNASKEILKKILDEYSIRYSSNSSIDSLFKCLNSLDILYDEINKIDKEILENKPFTKMYYNCITMLRKENNLSFYLFSIDYFRKILASNNLKLNGSKEIAPIYIITFLLEKMHRELNSEKCKNDEKFDNRGPHLIGFGEEIKKINETVMKFKFINDLLSKLDSPISNNLKGLIKMKNKCNACETITYLFNCYFIAVFDLKKILEKNNITSLDIKENLTKEISTEKEIYCGKCLNKTKQENKQQYYSFPDILIIFILKEDLHINIKLD